MIIFAKAVFLWAVLSSTFYDLIGRFSRALDLSCVTRKIIV